MKTFLVTISKNQDWKTVPFILIALGCALRLFHFIENRSLWLDEMYLASSLIKMNFHDLALTQLDYQQKAPIGFLWITRASVLAFGKSEMSLRLFPLICSFASLAFFLPVCTFFLKSRPAVILSIGILAFSPPLIYHAVEAKQYSTEVFSTIYLLYLYSVYNNKEDYSRLIKWGVLGALMVWFSYASIFVLAGIAGAVSLYHLIKKRYKLFFLNLIPFIFWMISFLISYVYFTGKTGESEWLVAWFKNREAFMPLKLPGMLTWLAQKAITFFDFPLGLSWISLLRKDHSSDISMILARMTLIPLFFFIVGLYYIILKKFKFALLLLFPFLLHIVASALQIYPFFERLLVYLAPAGIMVIAFGVETFLTSRRLHGFFNKNRQLPITLSSKCTPVVLALLLAGPVLNTCYELIKPDRFGRTKHWEQREMYEYLNSQYKKGDVVYIYWNAQVPYNYYKNIFKFKFKAIEGNDYRLVSADLNDYYSKLNKDFNKLSKYNRVWFIYCARRFDKIGDFESQPNWYYKGANHLEKRMPNELSKFGNKKDSLNTLELINLSLFEKQKK